MAGKTHGMGDQFWVGGVDLGADTNSFTKIGGGPATLPATNITQSAEARFGGQLDGGMEVISYWNADPAAAHSVYGALPTADVVATYAHTTLIGGPSANLNAKQTDYIGNRGQDGSFLLTVPMLADAFGLQWALQATAGKRTDAAATAAAAVSPLDQLVVSPGAFGATMYVQLFSLGSGSVTIKLQDSLDNAGDPYADVAGATTAALAAAVTAVRVQTASIAVKRYIKVVTTGVFTNAVFAVSVARHRTAVTF